MGARWQVSTRISLILLWRETTSPPYLQVTAWWPRWSSTPGHRVHWEPSEVSRPSHHFTAIWKTGGSRWSPRPSEGVTDSQAEAWGMDNRRALSANEDIVIRLLNRWSSNLEDSVFWIGGERRTDSTLMASTGKTKLLKTSTAWDRWWTDLDPKPDEQMEEM